MGRMDGPFTAPTWWDVPAVALTCHPHTRQLKPLPHPTPVIAVAFTRPAQMVNPRLDVEKTGGRSIFPRCAHRLMFELRREAVVKLDCQQILLKDQGNLVT